MLAKLIGRSRMLLVMSLILAFGFSAFVTPPKPRKVYIETDMEGVDGIVIGSSVFLESPRWSESVKLVTSEINAAVDGLLEGGATEVYVGDNHTGGGFLSSSSTFTPWPNSLWDSTASPPRSASILRFSAMISSSGRRCHVRGGKRNPGRTPIRSIGALSRSMTCRWVSSACPRWSARVSESPASWFRAIPPRAKRPTNSFRNRVRGREIRIQRDIRNHRRRMPPRWP